MLVQSHPYTDISQLKKKIDVSCINISCGYYNMHSNQEFISIDDVCRAIEVGKNMVNTLGYKKYEYEYKPIIYTKQTTTNSLVEFDDYEEIYKKEEKIYNLESVDIIEDTDGITISDIYDGVSIFISDDDLPDLYEILKYRILNKL